MNWMPLTPIGRYWLIDIALACQHVNYAVDNALGNPDSGFSHVWLGVSGLSKRIEKCLLCTVGAGPHALALLGLTLHCSIRSSSNLLQMYEYVPSKRATCPRCDVRCLRFSKVMHLPDAELTFGSSPIWLALITIVYVK